MASLNRCVNLQLPLALEHTAQRKQALHAFTSLLNGSGAPTTVDAQYVQQALLCLTAAEVLQLLDWTSVAQTAMTAPW